MGGLGPWCLPFIPNLFNAVLWQRKRDRVTERERKCMRERERVREREKTAWPYAMCRLDGRGKLGRTVTAHPCIIYLVILTTSALLLKHQLLASNNRDEC